MKVRAAHLMPRADMDVWLSLPRYNGHIIDPRYLDRSIAKDRYVTALGVWCRANPKTDWPDWLIDFATWMRNEHNSGRRHTATVSTDIESGDGGESSDLEKAA